jgi:hypothetical protein
VKALKSQAGDWFALLFLVAVLYMLVRPGSPAADAIGAISGAFNDLVKLATQG